MTSLEELKIYQNGVDLLFYTYKITIKYPKHEKNSLVKDLKQHTLEFLNCIIKAQKNYNINNRLEYLDKADSELKVIKILVRVSYKFKYINSKNYGAWSRKLSNVANPLNGWIKKCQSQ